MTVPVLILLVLGATYCLAHRGRDWPTALIFTALGVYGADTFIGDMMRGLVEAVGRLVGHITL